ncbi:MAG TPA: tetratricopeptide repeat protein [Vicinamibacterales bacterium]
MADARDTPRLLDLQRRVRQDPASLAFAPLAEEYRRAGRLDDAIRTCRAGLAVHPGYVSARATLGRALLDQGDLDEAFTELTAVLESAPEHLGALRGVADILHRRGELESALGKYRLALALARDDHELAARVAEIESILAQGTSDQPTGEPPARRQRAALEAWLTRIVADRAARNARD